GRVIDDLIAAEARDQALQAARRVQLRGVVEANAGADDAAAGESFQDLLADDGAARRGRDVNDERVARSVASPRGGENRCRNCAQCMRDEQSAAALLEPTHERTPTFFPACQVGMV